MSRLIQVIGGGPAGSAAALSALAAGAGVHIAEKSAAPHHKVCGEFLSPEVEPLLRKLGVWDRFLAEAPALIRRVRLRFPSIQKNWRLSSPAFGLSRFALDRLLLKAATSQGAVRTGSPDPALPTVVAHGRHSAAERGKRLFGFKAHFHGALEDSVELYFFEGGYLGVSPVEGGETNVCAMAPETLLQRHDFNPDSLIQSLPAVRERVRGLARSMEWLFTGPLVLGGKLQAGAGYAAGDALAFADPFTGSGILAALKTGEIAGRSAAGGASPEAHVRECFAALGLQYRISQFVRKVIDSGIAAPLAGLLPGPVIFQLTRPRI
ncbi:MAG: NAD(P)/FAD-dependent oxidoreductase [Bryobacteraceae bacterium]